ncbi:3-methyl-2-oxobutanoate hydroxymethyltransferase [Flavobacterium sp. WLB]|uniref:nuclear transport factor 2 family protein n=1 Tax=unclassified Flavobacterium TaxID=196869 RepID=UPI0006AB883A|nr:MULTISPECIES: nuclear transport factor 2 family protein [unclassified Flavobacterium]KOP36036.1 3-methyl-2-oxobutanoate hydroxymethyltransferase [Flavobacterium sp. VMW]OWU89643.1 3-methyl-2-oxobutanoate hydroxymethyltransferase [Flavobacterium sp. NLM]PUU69799.1 3-methyl-2-oxobutanoate hydroxymethyltransferase [Flavobacterium sp. WLB]
MRVYFILFFLLLGLSSNAQKQEVQKAIEIFFEGFHQKDSVKIKTVCADKMILQSISESSVKGNKLSNESADEFYKSIAMIPSTMKFQEKILNYNIQIDGTMAHVWAPYEFYLNDKLSHTGVNTFTLFKEKDSWKIIYLIDTRRK